jgi:hypothetical protein
MSNWKLAGKFLGFALELLWIGGLIFGAVVLAWWIAG